MKNLNILVTGGGSPGIAGTIYSLKNNYDRRNIKIICTDFKYDCVGRFLADNFYQIPKATDTEKYLRKLTEVCELEKIDIVLPQNTAELLILSNNKEQFANAGIKIIVSPLSQLSIANNKYELLKICKKISVPYPNYFLVSNKEELLISAKNIGWPISPFVVKPPASNGSRGIRIIDENKDYKELFYNEKPTNLYLKFEHFLDIIGDEFEPLLVMEYLQGDEVTIDVFRDNKNFICIQRKRDEVRSGISFQNSVHNDDRLLFYSKIISEYLDLQYCFGYQFKYDGDNIPKILECNPRVQGTMIFSTFMGVNLIYSSIKSVLGETLPQFTLDWDTKLLRYWGALGINKDGFIKI